MSKANSRVLQELLNMKEYAKASTHMLHCKEEFSAILLDFCIREDREAINVLLNQGVVPYCTEEERKNSWFLYDLCRATSVDIVEQILKTGLVVLDGHLDRAKRYNQKEIYGILLDYITEESRVTEMIFEDIGELGFENKLNRLLSLKVINNMVNREIITALEKRGYIKVGTKLRSIV